MVETREAPDLDRALEFPARLETTVKRMLAYSQCCCETAEVLSGLLLSASLTQALRERFSRLRDGQRVIGREMVAAVTAASEAMKQHEEGMLELPVTPSHNRPPATARFVICETPGCGSPIREGEAEASLKRHGNRICMNCERKRKPGVVSELSLEGIEMSETPEAFR